MRFSSLRPRRLFPRRPFVRVRLEALEDRSLPSTLTVTQAGDGGPGSLRQALLDANRAAGIDHIHFEIENGVQTITPLSPLPDITDPVILDATTQPGYEGTPLIELNGSRAGAFATGLTITAGDTVLKGLAINRFGGPGLVLTNRGGNTIQGSWIGVGTDGTTPLPNGGEGVQLRGSSDNLIGGTEPGAGNVLSGNRLRGLSLIFTSTNNRVQGNFIGTDWTGTAAVPNDLGGIFLGGSDNLIGGTDFGAANVVSGNRSIGITINGGSGNRVQGNLIGTDVSGTAALGNRVYGVEVATGGNSVGGAEPGAGNVIAGNAGPGVGVFAPANFVQGNFLGLAADGATALGNAVGVVVGNVRGVNNLIGGTEAGAGNVISGNTGAGVQLLAGCSANVVEGNLIGTNYTGDAALANAGSGVEISGHGNRVGGATPEEANTISGNGQHGILLALGSAADNLIQGNRIGTDLSGYGALGNLGDGIRIFDRASNNTIGSPEAGNLIAFNGGAGVRVGRDLRDPVTGNAIRGNSLHSNGGLGIDLAGDGVTANDEGDADTGPHGLQNFPTLTAAYAGKSAWLVGTFRSLPDRSYTLDFYASLAADDSGFGEGERYLGSVDVATDASGDASWEVLFEVPLTEGEAATATATDADGNTSEFGEAVYATLPAGSPGPLDGHALLVLQGQLPGQRTRGYATALQPEEMRQQG